MNEKLYQKIYNVMCDSEAVEKNMMIGSGKNSYKAVSEAAMLNLVKPLLKKHKLIVFPIEGEIKDNVMTWQKTGFDGLVKNDLRAITELKVLYKIVDIESGEFEILVGFGNGADPQDKGAGKASTYSFKNMLSKTFMLFSGEDTDNTHSDDIGKDKQQINMETSLNMIDRNKAQTIRNLATKKGVKEAAVCAAYSITKFELMNVEMWTEAVKKLELKEDKK